MEKLWLSTDPIVSYPSGDSVRKERARYQVPRYRRRDRRLPRSPRVASAYPLAAVEVVATERMLQGSPVTVETESRDDREASGISTAGGENV